MKTIVVIYSFFFFFPPLFPKFSVSELGVVMPELEAYDPAIPPDN